MEALRKKIAQLRQEKDDAVERAEEAERKTKDAMIQLDQVHVLWLKQESNMFMLSFSCFACAG